MVDRLTDKLNFQRQERDAYFDEHNPCNEPDCENCLYRNTVRKLLGTLVEAAQLNARCIEAAHEMWRTCADPACTYEERLIEQLLEGMASIHEAYIDHREAMMQWQTIPNDWDQAELDGIADTKRVMNVLHAQVTATVRQRHV